MYPNQEKSWGTFIWNLIYWYFVKRIILINCEENHFEKVGYATKYLILWIVLGEGPGMCPKLKIHPNIKWLNIVKYIRFYEYVDR